MFGRKHRTLPFHQEAMNALKHCMDQESAWAFMNASFAAGRMKHHMGLFEEAEADLLQAEAARQLGGKPPNYLLFAEMADLYNEMGRFEEARKHDLVAERTFKEENISRISKCSSRSWRQT